MRNNESGNALIFAITISTLALAILLLLTRVTDNQVNLASGFNYKVKTSIEKQNMFADSFKEGGNNEKLVNRAEINAPYTSKIVKIYDASDELYSMIQSMRTNGMFSLPNWGLIRQKLPSQTCPPAVVVKAPMRGSIRTCDFQEITINHSTVFVGNVKAKKLILNNVSNEKFVFAVIGNLESEEFVLKNVNGTILEIITAGEIKINATTTQNAEDSFIFMLSTADSIFLNGAVDFCDSGGNNKSGVKSLLNAERIVLNNKQINLPTYGCQYDSSEYVSDSESSTGGSATTIVGMSPNFSF